MLPVFPQCKYHPWRQSDLICLHQSWVQRCISEGCSEGRVLSHSPQNRVCVNIHVLWIFGVYQLVGTAKTHVLVAVHRLSNSLGWTL